MLQPSHAWSSLTSSSLNKNTLVWHHQVFWSETRYFFFNLLPWIKTFWIHRTFYNEVSLYSSSTGILWEAWPSALAAWCSCVRNSQADGYIGACPRGDKAVLFIQFKSQKPGTQSWQAKPLNPGNKGEKSKHKEKNQRSPGSQDNPATTGWHAWFIYTRGRGNNEKQVRHIKEMTKGKTRRRKWT